MQLGTKNRSGILWSQSGAADYIFSAVLAFIVSDGAFEVLQRVLYRVLQWCVRRNTYLVKNIRQSSTLKILAVYFRHLAANSHNLTMN